MHSEKVSFHLSLSNRQKWCFTGDESVRPWLEHLAEVMNLRPGKPEGTHRIAFTNLEDLPTPAGRVSRVRSTGDLIPGAPARNHTHAPDDPQGRNQSVKNRFISLERSSEGGRLVCRMWNSGDHRIAVMQMWRSLGPVWTRVENSGGLVLHGALVARRMDGALILGASGTGKSTCSLRIPAPWRPLCDDEVLVVKIDSRRYHAHPLPTWSEVTDRDSGRSWNVQEYVPLKAIFFLERGYVDQVERIGQGLAAVFINSSQEQAGVRRERDVSREKSRATRARLFENCSSLARSVPCYLLRATLQGRFWDEMAKVM